MPSIESTFKPARWLTSPHLQTLWQTVFKFSKPIDVTWQEVILRDGDSLYLGATEILPDAPWVMLIHGLEGTVDSHYVRSVFPALHKQGFNTLFMNLRGSGGMASRSTKSYHSGATDDLRDVLRYFEQTMPQQKPFAIIGVSLGGNLLLKYLGEEGNHAKVEQAIAVSVPFELAACAKKLEQGFSRIYTGYLLSALKASFKKKFSQIDNPLTVDLERINTLYAFDNEITAKLNGFKNADDYYAKCSSKPFLRHITVPTLIIHSLDDPFMYPSNAPTEYDISDVITLELTQGGGHVGFLASAGLFKLDRWLGKRITSYLVELRRDC